MQSTSLVNMSYYSWFLRHFGANGILKFIPLMYGLVAFFKLCEPVCSTTTATTRSVAGPQTEVKDTFPYNSFMREQPIQFIFHK